MAEKKPEKEGGLAGLAFLIIFVLLVQTGVIHLHFDQKALASGSVITLGGGKEKKKTLIVTPKHHNNLPPPKGCRNGNHMPGCLAVGYVRSGRIYIPNGSDIYDYKVAIGVLPTPATRVTPTDHVTTSYHPVKRLVWLSLENMANSLNQRLCHKVKAKNHKKHRVCKTLLGAVEVTCFETCHPYFTSSGYESDHTKGKAVDVGAVRWHGTWYTINSSFQYSHLGKTLLWRMTRACLKTGAYQAISLWDFGFGKRSIALQDHSNHLHCG